MASRPYSSAAARVCPSSWAFPARSWKGVYSANEFLTRINLMKAYRPGSATPVQHGKKVAVVGGGNVAMDAARCARRLGAERSPSSTAAPRMSCPPARKRWSTPRKKASSSSFLTNPLEILTDDNRAGCGAIRCQRNGAGRAGRFAAAAVPCRWRAARWSCPWTASLWRMGTSPNPLIKSTTEGLETQKWGGIVADEDTGQTSRQGVYAGGDAVTGAATVILAMGAGKTCRLGHRPAADGLSFFDPPRKTGRKWAKNFPFAPAFPKGKFEGLNNAASIENTGVFQSFISLLIRGIYKNNYCKKTRFAGK